MAKLSRATLDDLKKSGLDRKAAEKMGIRDVLPKEMAQIYREACIKLNIQPPKKPVEVAAYEILYFDPNGKKTGYSRYKLLEEYVFPGDKKPRKYLQLPGTKPKFYFSPFCNWAAIVASADHELYFVEGEKKAAALTLLGFPALGIGGVWSWRSREDEGSDLVSDFNFINWVNRKPVIVFDADV